MRGKAGAEGSWTVCVKSASISQRGNRAQAPGFPKKCGTKKEGPRKAALPCINQRSADYWPVPRQEDGRYFCGTVVLVVAQCQAVLPASVPETGQSARTRPLRALLATCGALLE